MRLLIYIHSLENGGAERVIANLANHWAAAGWDVTVVTVAPRATDFYVLDPAVERVCLDLAGKRPNLLASAVRLARRIRGLRRVLRRVRPDIALSAMHTANVVLAAAALGLPDLRTFGSEHNFPPRAPMGILWETMRRHAYARLSAVVALTRECADWLSAHTAARSVVVIPNAACWPLAAHAPEVDPATCCGPGRRVLLGVGRLSVEKNFATLVATFAKLAPRYPDWDLIILGEGPERGALEAQVRDAGLAGRVILPGCVGNPGAWYARAGLYAMTSHFEGFPNTLVEAMAHGLPAVSFDCDTGPRDIIRQGIDGLLVPPGDAGMLAEALDGLMGDDARRRAFAVRATEVRERFSMAKIAAMWEAVFLRHLAARRGDAAPVRAGGDADLVAPGAGPAGKRRT